MKLKSTKKEIHILETYLLEKTDLKVTKKYINGKLNAVDLIGKGPHGSTPVVVKPEFKEFIKTNNPFHTYHKNVYASLEDVDFDKAVKDKLIYYFYNAGHILFDIKGNPIPLVRTFDYIGTDFHSCAIDLDQGIKVLSKHKWVLNKEALKKESVPSYNADNYSHEYIKVTLLPDAKAYKEMYNMTLTIKNSNFSTILRELEIGKSYNFPKWDPLKLHKLRIKEKD